MESTLFYHACSLSLFFFTVDAVWKTWGSWTSCSVSCGYGGTRQRTRSFHPGRNGGRNQPVSGQSLEEEACSNLPACPGVIIYCYLTKCYVKSPFQWLQCGRHGAHGLVAQSLVGEEAPVRGPGASRLGGMELATNQKGAKR